MSRPLEWSDDNTRGLKPHIRSVLNVLDELRADPFRRCCVPGCHEPAAVLVNTRSPRIICRHHNDEWRSLTRLQRHQAVMSWMAK